MVLVSLKINCLLKLFYLRDLPKLSLRLQIICLCWAYVYIFCAYAENLLTICKRILSIRLCWANPYKMCLYAEHTHIRYMRMLSTCIHIVIICWAMSIRLRLIIRFVCVWLYAHDEHRHTRFLCSADVYVLTKTISE